MKEVHNHVVGQINMTSEQASGSVTHFGPRPCIHIETIEVCNFIRQIIVKVLVAEEHVNSACGNHAKVFVE